MNIPQLARCRSTVCISSPHKITCLLWWCNREARSTTDWPASKAVGIQGASCRCCQDGLQVLCQLLHCESVIGYVVGHINQLALLSQQVGAEHSTPRQPAVYARTLTDAVRNVLTCRKGALAKATHKGHTVSSYMIKALQVAYKCDKPSLMAFMDIYANDQPPLVAFADKDVQMQELAETTWRRVVQ